MTINRNLARLVFSFLLIALASTAHAQTEYPDELKQKFVKPETVQREASVPKLNGRQKGKQERRGFFRPYGPSAWVSSAVYWAGSGMDIASSDQPNFREGNSLFRNERGGTAMGKNIAATLGIYGGTLVVEKFKPEVAFLIRMGVGVGRMIVAARNWKKY
ncbi:MAG TPA: hypothetical protein VN256_13285 [Pyrinomonadaceae bacterium]|nr:hypothetical protein [Pyrinomonadaceae bacterium]